MKRAVMILAAVSIGMMIFSGPVAAKQSNIPKIYTITITNLTRGQIFSPPIALVHNEAFKLFTFGEPASGGLTLLAEDGDTQGLMNMAESMDSIYGYTVAQGMIMPGESVSFDVEVLRSFQYLSVAGMLVTTNDAFFALNGIRVTGLGRAAEGELAAYDAGTEANSESCADIPGPPCGNGGVRNTAGAEGYVHVHPGIHGGGDIMVSDHDWQNPVAAIRIELN